MKTAATILMMLVLAACRVAADDSISPPVNIEKLISSLPNQIEREKWKSYSEEERHSPAHDHLAEKMKDLQANCQQLRSLLVVGKPLSDYPGLLAVGHLVWMHGVNWYILTVDTPWGRIGSGDFAGFQCQFDQAFTIVTVSSRVTPGF